MDDNSKKDLIRYDIYIDDQNKEHNVLDESSIGGIKPKEFIRVNSRIFGEFISLFKSEKPHYYDTSFNDLLNSGYIPKFLPALYKKETELRTYQYADANANMINTEVLSSNLANLFEIPTVYNMSYSPIDIELSDDNSMAYLISKQTIDRNKKLISLDFVRENEHLVSMTEFLDSFWSTVDNSLEDVINKFKSSLQFNKLVLRMKDLDIDKIIVDFIKQYMFRKYVLQDADYCSRNVSVLVNKIDKYIRLAPSYDYNMAMPNKQFSGLYTYEIKKDFEFLAKEYPQLLKAIIHNYKNISTRKGNSSISAVVDKSIENNEDRMEYKLFLEKSIGLVLNEYNKFNSIEDENKKGM